MIGRVLWFDIKKGFGFIRANNKDYFAHYSKIDAPSGEFRVLEEGEIVEFQPVEVDRGHTHKPQAVQIRRSENEQEEMQA